MDIPKVLSHHPAILQSYLASWEQGSQAAVQLLADSVHHDRTNLKQVLGYHSLLVDVVDIGQVEAKGACLQYFSALAAFNVMGIPFAGRDTYPLHSAMGLGRELGPYATWGADHCLRL
jgi:hypothetical protein